MTENYTIGDRLVRTKGGILTKHHALYIGQGMVVENHVNHGVQEITLEQFLKKGKLVRIERGGYSVADQIQIIRRAKALVGKQYNLLKYNCEHFVNHVLKGKAESKQIDNLVMGAILGVLFLAGILAIRKGRIAR